MANVRRRSPQEKMSAPQKNYNRLSDVATGQAKDGTIARWGAEEIEYENQVRRNSGKKPEVKKINSNPVPGRTRIGNLSGKARGGGLGGGGWMDQLR